MELEIDFEGVQVKAWNKDVTTVYSSRYLEGIKNILLSEKYYRVFVDQNPCYQTQMSGIFIFYLFPASKIKQLKTVRKIRWKYNIWH